MVNVFDWDTFTKTWKGIGDIFGGVSAYIMTPYDWAMDKMFGPADHSDTDRQKKALRDFGKSLVAYDEWGENPARAGGTAAFNLLTLGSGAFLKLGKAGLAAKAGEAGEAGGAASAVSRVAKVANAFGKAGRLVDPMTYVGKGASFAKLKVGDLMAGLKGLHSGAADDFLHGAGSPEIPDTHAPVTVSDKSVRYPDGSILHEDGTMVSPEGKPHQNPIPVESSAADRLARHEISPPHTPAHADQPVPTHVGGGTGAEAASHASGHGALSGSPHGAAHAGGDAGHGANSGDHGSGHGSGDHDAAGHGGYHGPADSGTGHGGGGDLHHGQHGQQPTDHVEEPPAPKPSGHIPEHTFDHVLKGELKYGKNGQPRVVGYHFRPGGRDPYGVKVPKILEIDHKTGLTTGNVWMRDPRTGIWVMKRAKSTFFPPTWTEREVRRAMVKAFENSRVIDPEAHMWKGEYKGITFEGYFDPVTGDATTVYPIMPRE
ncbi:EndoU domain-containing protein [Streptomyces echinoruber]|uniref:Bacterial EndoU nuclease domain-containing protein n=1 Tax=Streptomyces echinoruber TaxID=68898 RepID=A0A918QQN4_9ACTN|nr:EndoU domain-containing protein [Streptomyces echinoruber]GGZ67712.1 hypothetical protein GCM10010389_01110 [Streptomyces echinoruber]